MEKKDLKNDFSMNVKNKKRQIIKLTDPVRFNNMSSFHCLSTHMHGADWLYLRLHKLWVVLVDLHLFDLFLSILRVQ